MARTTECYSCGSFVLAELPYELGSAECVRIANEYRDRGIGLGHAASDRWGGPDRLYCEDCVTHCAYCERWYFYDLSDHRHYCESCDSTFCHDGYYYCDECDRITCEDCGECECCGNHSGIRNYCYEPDAWIPKGDGRVLFGVELEIGGSPSVIVNTVRDFDPDESHLILKSDGSLDEGGAEIVTHPMSLSWAADSYLTDLLRSLRRNGCNIPHSGYGLHVHVARSSFRNDRGRHSTFHAALWQMFIYRNKPEVAAIARRSGSQWAQFECLDMRGIRERAGATPWHGDRYVAINCNNEHTYEVRVFKSTLTPRYLFSALELLDASVEYTRTMTSGDVIAGALDWFAFIRWINADEDRAARYAHLADSAIWAGAE